VPSRRLGRSYDDDIAGRKGGEGAHMGKDRRYFENQIRRRIVRHDDFVKALFSGFA
jgi:hypothetical protein